ncbi:hypothetical protein H4218_005108 [Coemansia sp. IMI 209128]|nr:hypothetical protein GGI10_002530 [Coemansia sp. RSA 2530]KAJ2695692.1 hypothetical protein H4218_005108 [Coemansia sp. IMI 209128]
MDINSSGSREERPAASTFGRLTGSRFQVETPPRSASLRQRRGVFSAESLEFQSFSTPASKLDEESMAVDGTESVQESTLRKRERIAELRRRRQEQSSRAGLGAGFFEEPADAPPASPPMSLPLRARGLESPESHGFFERGDLALLLRPVEVPDIDKLLEPPQRPLQRPPPPAREADRRASLNRPLMPLRCNAADFTINIPSTSLSPVLPQGWARNGLLVSRQQQRRRLAAQQDDSDDGDEEQPRRVTPNVDREVAAQLEAELARNQQLHAELARLHLKTRKLANLVIASQNIKGVD